MKSYLLDTHIWFWYLTGSRRLPRKIKDILDRPEEMPWISPISAWELGALAEKKRVEIAGDFRTWCDEAISNYPLHEAPLNLEIALKSGEIPLPHQDPAD